MKLYREGKNEIRIQLTSEDLEELSISLEEFDYENTKGKKVIWQLFDKAREETGFDAEGEKVYIQLYPKAKGGCELFVTKIEEDEKKDCFSFSGFDSFFQALSFLGEWEEDVNLYREKTAGIFFISLPTYKTPPHFYEFGEKVDMPSPLYFQIRCQKLENTLVKLKKI